MDDDMGCLEEVAKMGHLAMATKLKLKTKQNDN